MALSSRFDRALVYASEIHRGQTRKGGSVPYIAHLLGVASIVLEHGATEDEAIGALLHDAAEDAGGHERIDDIRERFGDKVADIVDACSDTMVIPKPPWRKRKEDHIDHLKKASTSVRLVVAADKLYNAQSMIRDHRIHGDSLWSRFNAPKEDTVWFYRSVTEALRHAGPCPLIDELDRCVTELERVAMS